MNLEAIHADYSANKEKYTDLLKKNNIPNGITTPKSLTELKVPKEEGNVTVYRAKARLREIGMCLPPGYRIHNNSVYLDIGCGDGLLTKEIAYGLRCYETHGVDLDNFSGAPIKCGLKNFKLVSQEAFQLPYKDGTFDLITVFQVLHHAKSPATVIREAVRVLKKGGILILREHDGIKEVHRLIDFEHLLYEKFDLNKYIGNYLPAKEWDQLIGLKPLGGTPVKGPTRYYTKAYIK